MIFDENGKKCAVTTGISNKLIISICLPFQADQLTEEQIAGKRSVRWVSSGVAKWGQGAAAIGAPLQTPGRLRRKNKAGDFALRPRGGFAARM